MNSSAPSSHSLRHRTWAAVGRPFRATVCSLPLVAVFLGGCLSRPALPRQEYALTFLAAQPARERVDGPVDLRVSIAPQFAGRPLVYRAGENSYETDPYAEWVVAPKELIDQAVRRWMRDSAFAPGVTASGSLIRARQVVEVTVEALYGDFRSSTSPMAVMRLRILRLARTNAGEPQVHQDLTSEQKVPLSGRNPAALVDGWSRALAAALTEFQAAKPQ